MAAHRLRHRRKPCGGSSPDAVLSEVERAAPAELHHSALGSAVRHKAWLRHKGAGGCYVHYSAAPAGCHCLPRMLDGKGVPLDVCAQHTLPVCSSRDASSDVWFHGSPMVGGS